MHGRKFFFRVAVKVDGGEIGRIDLPCLRIDQEHDGGALLEEPLGGFAEGRGKGRFPEVAGGTACGNSAGSRIQRVFSLV